MKIRHVVLLVSFLAVLPALKAQECPPVVVLEHIHPTVATVVQGNVQNKAGALVAGLSVTITGSTIPKLKQTAVTDDRGQFHFDSVPAGKYTLTIEHTAGTAKRTEVECDSNGVCQMVFILKPPRNPSECRYSGNHDKGPAVR